MQLESEFDEETGCGRAVVDHDADVVHPLDRQVLDGKESRFEPRRQGASLGSLPVLCARQWPPTLRASRNLERGHPRLGP
jgi:hypothetical protein